MKRMIGIGAVTATPAIIGLAAGLLGTTHAASAQNAYSYPWCAVLSQDGQRECYYTTEEQCRTTMSGIYGICVRNLQYRGGSTSDNTPPAPRRRR